jgi:hypothetical protein
MTVDLISSPVNYFEELLENLWKFEKKMSAIILINDGYANDIVC